MQVSIQHKSFHWLLDCVLSWQGGLTRRLSAASLQVALVFRYFRSKTPRTQVPVVYFRLDRLSRAKQKHSWTFNSHGYTSVYQTKVLIKCHRYSNRKHPQYLQIYGSYVRILFPCGWQLYLSGGRCTILERKAHLWWHSPIPKFLCTVTQVLKPREMCAWSTPHCGCYVVVCVFTPIISDPVKIELVTYVGKKNHYKHIQGKNYHFPV